MHAGSTIAVTLGLGLSAAACRGGATEPPSDGDVVATALAIAREDTDCEAPSGRITHRGTAPLVRTFDVIVDGCGDRSLYQVNCGRAVCEAERKGDLAEPPPLDPSRPPQLPEPIRIHRER